MEIELTEEHFLLVGNMIKSASKSLTPQQAFDGFKYLMIEMTLEVNKANNNLKGLDAIKEAQSAIEPDLETYKKCREMVQMMDNVVTPCQGIAILAFILKMMTLDFDRPSDTIH